MGCSITAVYNNCTVSISEIFEIESNLHLGRLAKILKVSISFVEESVERGGE